AMKLTGITTTTVSALSEGVFWDFKAASLSNDVLNYFQFNASFFPEIKGVFAIHGTVTADIANKLMLSTKVAVSYKAGDQPNNALSLNVL
ncbi:hypothetical protein ABTM92_19515, partial [Acinetobacter baumannii]